MPPVYDVTGTYTSGITIDGDAFGSPLFIENTARITDPAGSGVTAPGGAYVNNSGTIDVAGTGVVLDNYSSLFNQAGGSISGAIDGVDLLGNGTYLKNAGTIAGTDHAVYMGGDFNNLTVYSGAVFNGDVVAKSGSNSQIILMGNAGTLDGVGSKYLNFHYIQLYTGADWSIGSITNEVTIENRGTIDGIDLRAGGTVRTGGLINNGVAAAGASVSINNYGTIVAADHGVGVDLTAGGSLLNNTFGHIVGGDIGVRTGGASATVENAGAIGAAVELNADTNRLIIDGGATFGGTVTAAATSANTLELTSHGGAGTLSGLGSHYAGFQTVTIDSGAAWDIKGSLAGIEGSTIQGFSNHDLLDITDQAFAAGETASFDSGSQILSIRDSGGSLIGTVQLGGIAYGYGFHVADDGNGHIAIHETIDRIANSSHSSIFLTEAAYSNPLTITATGTVSGGYAVSASDVWTIVNHGTIDGGIGISLPAGGSVSNSGLIFGHGAYGVQFGYGTGTLDNSGTIRGATYGVQLGDSANGSVTNAAGGYIFGGQAGVAGTYQTLTIENAGTIFGVTRAVYMGADTNRLIVDAGAVFTGDAVAKSGSANTLELSAKTGAGTINGIGTDFTNFQTVTIDSGATWIIGSIGVSTTVQNAGTIDNNSNDRGIELTVGGSLTNAASGLIQGDDYGVRIAGLAGTVVNAGTIEATVASAGYGVGLMHGGLLSNSANGYILGSRYGVYVTGTAGTIRNSGTIAAGPTGAAAVELKVGGSLTNSGTGSITGGAFGVRADTNSGTVINHGSIGGGSGVALYNSGQVSNDGTILGTTGSGIILSHGGIVYNVGTGSIGGNDFGVDITGASGMVHNSGTITGSNASIGVGVELANGGNVTNETGGTITGGFDGVYLKTAGTVINHGSLRGGAGVELGNGGLVSNDGSIGGSAYGVYFDNGGSLTNAAGGTIHASSGSAIQAVGAAGTIDNTGGISGGYAGIDLEHGGSVVNHGTGSVVGYDFGVRIIGASGTIDNSGTIKSTGGNTTGAYLGKGGAVTNEAGGTIARTTAGVLVGSLTSTVTGIVSNDGTIDGGLGVGVSMYGDGSLTNMADGSISGGSIGVFMSGPTGTVENAGAIAGGQFGVVLNSYGASVGNSGTIAGGYEGVLLGHGGAITNAAGGTITGVSVGGGPATIDNAGTISSGAGLFPDHDMGGYTIVSTYGVFMGDGTLLNEHTGTIGGGITGVYVSSLGANATVENAGTITGGTYAVDLNATITNRLIVDAGAVFNGTVIANTSAANTIELTSGASAGTLSGLGTQYRNFQTVHIDANATWTIGGTKAGIGTTTIQGFNTHDTLDITDLTFASGDTVNINDTTDVLTILGADGTTVLDTIQLAGNFAGKFFHLSDDGTHGSYIQEDGTACYCRGTLILTSKGEVPVEDLKIGDRLITHWGAKRPIRWIGTRSYDGRFATGNKNVLPVLIKADALGDTVPRRDLWISPLHAMFIDGALVPAYALVNGTSITQATSVDQVEYFHLELDSHDVIFAEGALSETFIDDDSRNMFHNVADYYALYPNAKRKPAEYCARMIEEGPELEAIRRRIAARVGRMKAA